MSTAKQWKIVAWPTPAIPELNGKGENISYYHDLMRQSCQNGLGKMAGWDYIDNYTSLDDLVAQVKDKTKAPLDTLKEFEIFDHGYPYLLDGLSVFGDIVKYAKEFKTFKWDDLGRFYLTGCNTGNNDPNLIFGGKRGGVCVTEDLCNQMLYNVIVPPANPKWFAHKILFFGLKGYGSDASHMLDQSTDATMKVEKSFTDDKGVDYTEYMGAEDATGPRCWRIFLNY